PWERPGCCYVRQCLTGLGDVRVCDASAPVRRARRGLVVARHGRAAVPRPDGWPKRTRGDAERACRGWACGPSALRADRDSHRAVRRGTAAAVYLRLSRFKLTRLLTL